MSAPWCMDKKHQALGAVLDWCWRCTGARGAAQPITSPSHRNVHAKKRERRPGGGLRSCFSLRLRQQSKPAHGRLQSTPQYLWRLPTKLVAIWLTRSRYIKTEPGNRPETPHEVPQAARQGCDEVRFCVRRLHFDRARGRKVPLSEATGPAREMS